MNFVPLFSMTVTDPITGTVHVVLSRESIARCKQDLVGFMGMWVRRASSLPDGAAKQYAIFCGWNYEITGLVFGERRTVEQGPVSSIPLPPIATIMNPMWIGLCNQEREPL